MLAAGSLGGLEALAHSFRQIGEPFTECPHLLAGTWPGQVSKPQSLIISIFICGKCYLIQEVLLRTKAHESLPSAGPEQAHLWFGARRGSPALECTLILRDQTGREGLTWAGQRTAGKSPQGSGWRLDLLPSCGTLVA